jgi:beta-galactosidase/beta-glucuronidase
MLNNISIEAEEQIKRLRNHPSVALFCGNNEISEAWANWGWKNISAWESASPSVRLPPVLAAW